MGTVGTLGRKAFRDFVLDGVPSSGPNKTLKSEIRDFVDAVDAAVAAADFPSLVFASWTALSAVNGTYSGQRAEIPTATGTHTDPVVGGTVSNKGLYSWSVSPAGWQRVGDIIDVSTKADVNSPTLTGSPAAPTPTTGDSSTRIATTAFVQTSVADKAPLDSPSLTGTPTAPTPASDAPGTRIATKSYVDDTLVSHGLGGYFDNVEPIVDPVNFHNIPGAQITIQDGDDAVVAVRSRFGYWRPANGFAPPWVSEGLVAGFRFHRNRLFRPGYGYLPLSYAMVSTRDSSSIDYARNLDGTWRKFNTVGEPRCTDAGLWVEGNSANHRNWLKYATDLSIVKGVQVTAISGDLIDGETLTWAGGGSGTYVADQSDLTNRILALRNASGTFTGAMTGGTSGATAALVGSIYDGWGASNMEVTRDQTGFDGTTNRGCRLKATSNNATLTQTVSGSGFTEQVCNVNLGIKRIAGTGDVSVSMDGGATWTVLTFDSSGIAWVQGTPGNIATPIVIIKMAVSGDEVAIPHIQLEYEANKSSLIPQTWNVNPRRNKDNLTLDLSTSAYLRNLFQGRQFTVVMRIRTIAAITGTFLQVDDSEDRDASVPNPDNSMCYNFAYKEEFDAIQVGLSTTVGGTVTGGIDPPTYLPRDTDTIMAWSIDYDTRTIIASMLGESTTSVRGAGTMPDPSSFKTVRWGSQEGGSASLDGTITVMDFYNRAMTDTELDVLTGPNSPLSW